MIEDATVSIGTAFGAVFLAVGWAASIAGVYFGLKGRLMASELRIESHAIRLDEGSSKFAALQVKHEQHGNRLTALETLLGSMDSKIDDILKEVKQQ